MSRFPRRRLAFLAATAAAGLGIAPRARAQSLDVPGAYAHVDQLPGVAGPYSALAGVDPGLAVPAEWTVTKVPVLPALPTHLQTFVDQVIVSKPARAAFNSHSYGWESRKAGFCSHIPVAPSLTALDNYFTSGTNVGLTHWGTGREWLRDLEIVAADGAVWRIPVARVSQYLPLTGVSPWSQGRIATSPWCAVAPHRFAWELGSGVVNGAILSNENVAMSGADSLTSPQYNSQVFLRAIGAAYFGYEISPATNIWHAQLDQRDRCFDTGWTGGPLGGIEIESQPAARALLAGDPSKLRGAVRISAPPPAINAQDEAWKALVNTRLRNQADAIRVAVREDYDQGREAALAGIDPSNWLDVAIQAWRDQEVRAADDLWLATVRRDAARAQLARLVV
ncbi:MAG: hypothetical protein AB7R89_28655 [Dehalococcoidia bacterium]